MAGNSHGAAHSHEPAEIGWLRAHVRIGDSYPLVAVRVTRRAADGGGLVAALDSEHQAVLTTAAYAVDVARALDQAGGSVGSLVVEASTHGSEAGFWLDLKVGGDGIEDSDVVEAARGVYNRWVDEGKWEFGETLAMRSVVVEHSMPGRAAEPTTAEGVEPLVSEDPAEPLHERTVEAAAGRRPVAYAIVVAVVLLGVVISGALISGGRTRGPALVLQPPQTADGTAAAQVTGTAATTQAGPAAPTTGLAATQPPTAAAATQPAVDGATAPVAGPAAAEANGVAVQVTATLVALGADANAPVAEGAAPERGAAPTAGATERTRVAVAEVTATPAAVGPSVAATAGPTGAPIAAATPAGVGTVVFDFAAGRDSGLTWPSDPRGVAWFDSDGYHLATRRPGQFVALDLLPNREQAANFAVTATFRKVGGPPGGGYGIVVGDQQTPAALDGSSQRGTFFVFEVGDKGEVGAWRRDDEQWVDLLGWTGSGAVHSGQTENMLQVTVVGGQAVFSVNGTNIALPGAPAVSSGGLGVFLGGDANEAVLSHLAVARLD